MSTSQDISIVDELMNSAQTMTTLSPSMSQSDILKAIQEKSRLISIQQSKADRGEFKSYGGAIGLQRLRLERKEFMGKLDKLRLVTD